MRHLLGRRIRSAALATTLLGALAGDVSPVSAQGSPVIQAPSNVTAPAKFYVVESIVIVVLFAAALFAVCRSSGRT